MVVSRRSLALGAAALPLVAIIRPARAAEFSYKMANNTPVTHPLTLQMQAAAERVLKATGGRVEIRIFPNSQLGSDTDMLSQLRVIGPDSVDLGATSEHQRCRLRVQELRPGLGGDGRQAGGVCAG